MDRGSWIMDALATSKTWCLDGITRESRMEDALCCSGVEEEATKPATGAGRASRPLVIRVHGARAGRSCKLPGPSARPPASQLCQLQHRDQQRLAPMTCVECDDALVSGYPCLIRFGGPASNEWMRSHSAVHSLSRRPHPQWVTHSESFRRHHTMTAAG
jgi:hypothetical protein